MDQQNNLNFACRIISRAPSYGNGNTDGICSSILPPSPSLSISYPSDDDGLQSPDEDDCRSQSTDAYALIPFITPYPSNNRRKNEIKISDGIRKLIL